MVSDPSFRILRDFVQHFGFLWAMFCARCILDNKQKDLLEQVLGGRTFNQELQGYGP